MLLLVPSANVDAKELAAARDEAQRLKAEASALTEALETCRYNVPNN